MNKPSQNRDKPMTDKLADGEMVERAIIDAIEAQFDIHAMDAEDWAEMHTAISAAIAPLLQPSSDKLVTDAMIEAGAFEFERWSDEETPAQIAIRIYRAMEAARPLSDGLAMRLNDWADQQNNPDLARDLRVAAAALQHKEEAERERDELRRQGQDEGFAAAVAELRGLSAQKPPAPMHHVASLLADSLERSRIPCRAVKP